MHKIVNGVSVPMTEKEIKEITKEWESNKAEIERVRYAADRQLAYPSIADQLDMLYHAMDEGKLSKDNEFYVAIKAVKDKHPKPE